MMVVPAYFCLRFLKERVKRCLPDKRKNLATPRELSHDYAFPKNANEYNRPVEQLHRARE